MTHSPRSLATALPRLLLFLIGMTCLSLVALQPFTHGTLPYSADGLLQLYRTAALDHSLHVDQALWSRYASGLVYGYGAPLFNFFPPLSYYPALLLHRLGLSYLDSWLLTMSAYTVLAASGSFLLARLWTRSDLAGWLAAAAYIYSPYLLFDSINRGASAELAALAALPFALYGMTRLAFHPRRINLSLALLAFALFIPLHTLITLHGSALLALYCLFLVWRAHERRAVFLRLALAIALALLLTAFYWLPALLESDAIKLGLITEQLSHIDIERHLRPLSAILALPHTADPTQQNFPTPITLGWLQLLISTAGTLLSLRPAHRPHRSLLLTLSALVAALIFLNTPASAWLWKNIPLIGYTQFPWRTLGLASLLLALMTGISAALLLSTVRGARRATALITSLTLLLLLQGTPWTYSLHRSDTALADIRDVQQFERDTGQLALSSYAEYLPINADAAHLDPLALATPFSSADTIPRLHDSDALTIHSAHWRGTSATLQLDSQQPQTLIFDWLYVPGFSAYRNGERIDTFPSTPAGLVALEIPAGTIDLRIALESTPIQSLSLVVSGLGLLATAIVLLPRWLLWTPSAPAPSRLEPRWLLTFAAIGIGLFFFKATLLDHNDTPFKRARFGPIAASPALANFGDRIDLLAIDMPNACHRSAHPYPHALLASARRAPRPRLFQHHSPARSRRAHHRRSGRLCPRPLAHPQLAARRLHRRRNRLRHPALHPSAGSTLLIRAQPLRCRNPDRPEPHQRCRQPPRRETLNRLPAPAPDRCRLPIPQPAPPAILHHRAPHRPDRSPPTPRCRNRRRCPSLQLDLAKDRRTRLNAASAIPLFARERCRNLALSRLSPCLRLRPRRLAAWRSQPRPPPTHPPAPSPRRHLHHRHRPARP